ECAAQVAALLEVCKRRRIEKRDIVLLFIDVKKAYDSVPHGALFFKLAKAGVRGPILAFVKALYAGSKMRVRTGYDPAILSPVAHLRRGLRQGCPLSPTLFNVFINDIFDGHEDLGVLARYHWRGTDGLRIPGLLFADDLVSFIEDAAGIRPAVERLETWLNDNELQVGHHKCGFLKMGRVPGFEEAVAAAPLQGAAVPIVESYTYLGLEIRPDLSRQGTIADRLAKARRLAGSMHSFLRRQDVPIQFRTAVARTVLIPAITYGAEIFAFNKSFTRGAQQFINTQLKLIAGVARGQAVSNVALWHEFGVPPLCATANGQRARLLSKGGRELRTWLAKMVERGYKARRTTWITNARRWLNTHTHRLLRTMLTRESVLEMTGEENLDAFFNLYAAGGDDDGDDGGDDDGGNNGNNAQGPLQLHIEGMAAVFVMMGAGNEAAAAAAIAAMPDPPAAAAAAGGAAPADEAAQDHAAAGDAAELDEARRNDNERRLIGPTMRKAMEFAIQPGGWEAVENPKVLSRLVRAVVWMREDRNYGDAKYGRRYLARRFEEQRLTRASLMAVPGAARGVSTMVRMRIGAFNTTERLARWGLRAARYKHECPCCHSQEPETIGHIFLRCPRWASKRDELLTGLIEESRAAVAATTMNRMGPWDTDEDRIFIRDDGHLG
ncbi:Retrovirus-related Pol polyprotein from type-1 retrotransposable element R2, partial [Hondaea fermentalgiana]